MQPSAVGNNAGEDGGEFVVGYLTSGPGWEEILGRLLTGRMEPR